MKLDRSIVPEDSALLWWLDSFSHTEVFTSWQILTGLAALGALLGRTAAFPTGRTGMVWPNMSILLIGPSGTGKDTVINPTCEMIESLGGTWIRGRTMEGVKESLCQMGDPAVGFINASELAEFLGCKDYQQGMVQSLTDILTNKDKLDVSLKSDVAKGSKGSRTIYRPTLTMFAGSTAEWVQTMLPDGSLDGGFIPRFVVAAEWDKRSAGIITIPNSGRYESRAHRDRVEQGEIRYREFLSNTVNAYAGRPETHQPTIFHETAGDTGAEAWYENWCANRYTTFSPLLQAYAERSRGLMRKLGMLMAISRGHWNYIETIDYLFADAVIRHAAERLERAIIPTSREVKVGFEILRLLPSTYPSLLRQLSSKYGTRWVKAGVQYLLESGQIKQSKEGTFEVKS